MALALVGLAWSPQRATAQFSEAAAIGGNAFTADTLNPPTGPGASVSGTSVTVTWTATSDTYAAGHRVFRSATSGSGYVQIAQVTPRSATSYVDTPGTGTYYYVVRAYHQSWESADSAQASATVTPPSPAFYLHNDPTPPTAHTTSQTDLTMDPSAPGGSTLYNYDTDRDAFAGLAIAKGGVGASESDPTKYQAWRSSPMGSTLAVAGTVSVQFWSGMKDFDQTKRGSVRVYLRTFDGAAYTERCNGLLTVAAWQGGSPTWVFNSVDFTCTSFVVAVGHQLEVKLIVNDSGDPSDDDMWFAYDAASYPTRMVLP